MTTVPTPRGAGLAVSTDLSVDPLASTLVWAAVADSLHERIAVLDEAGTILAVNDAWAMHRHTVSGSGVGDSYLEACAGHAGSAAVQAVLGGRETLASAVYPGADRWYRIRVTRLGAHVRHRGDAVAVVVHTDITDELGAVGAGGSVQSGGPSGAGTTRRLERELEALTNVHQVRDALSAGRLHLHAQPIMDLGRGTVVQHELLLRIEETDGRLVGPVDFLAGAERHGLIGDVDRWVVQQAIAFARSGSPVEVNVSAASIGDQQLIADIETWIGEAVGLDPRDIVFEITETALIADEQTGREFVERLRALGCGIALDDFGTGYGGFTYLKKLPVDFLKIDVEFVRDLATNQASRHVVQAVVNLARSFGLKTVAEGVEDQATLELLGDMGVHFGQGYYLGMPAPMGVATQRKGGRG